MGRNDEFYHGSSHDFNPGDVVEPRTAGWAWSSTNPHYAKNFGKNIYQVQPIGEHTSALAFGDDFGIYMSQNGYTVVRKLP